MFSQAAKSMHKSKERKKTYDEEDKKFSTLLSESSEVAAKCDSRDGYRVAWLGFALSGLCSGG